MSLCSVMGSRDNAAGLNFKLRSGVSFLALCAISIAAPAMAQTAGAPASGQEDQEQDEVAGASGVTEPVASEEEILVTGYRESLRTAQDIKRNSDVIVDSVTAEDIGALPDRSVTETLQRIPGVAINRFAAGVDPDHFSVEGSGVVVRGLTYVRSEFNGREAFSANNGRALGFADVASELLGGVDVFKSPSADRIEGGIAGVVNLRTRKPLDNSDEFVLAGSLEINYGDFVEKSAPTFSVLASHRWDTPIGDIGILGSFVYSQLFSRADRFQISSYRPRNLYTSGDVIPDGGGTIEREVLFPRGAVLGTQEFDRERYGYSAAVQWRSPDNSMEAVFQFLRSDARQSWTERTVEIATDNVANNGDSRRVPGTTLTFDEDGLFDSGYITGPTGWRGDQNDGAARVPILGLQSNNIRRDHVERLVTDDYGFNFRWDVNERIGLNFDYQHVESSTYMMDNGLWTSSYQNVFIDMNGSEFPVVVFGPPQVCSGPSANATEGCSGAPGSANSPLYYSAGHNSFLDPYNTFYRSAMDHIEDSTGNADSFRIDGELSFPDSNFLGSIRAGFRFADRDQTARFSTYNWGALSEQWGGGGPVWLTDNVDSVAGGSGGSPAGNYEAYLFGDFFRGSVPNPMAGGGRLFYSRDTTNYDEYVAFANSIVREWTATPTGSSGGWLSLADRAGVVAGTPFLPGEINSQRERNYAGYIMARFDRDFANGWNLSGNVGVRYTTTNRRSEGFIAFPQAALTSEADCAAVPPGQTPPAFCTFSPEIRAQARAYLNGALTESVVDLDYDYWLPSVNVKLEVGGGLQFRAAYFKGVAPPQFGFTRNYFNVTGFGAVQNVDDAGNAIPGSFRLQSTFNAGNPYLMPVEADNFDITAEWYFDDVGQLTVSAFYKELTNVLTNDIAIYDLPNNGVSFPAVVTTPVNSSEKGKIKGFEVAYQQTYDFLPGALGGFGLQANYTYVDSEGVPQSTLSETEADAAAGRVPTLTGAGFPLQGLSEHTVNITPFYEMGPLSIRATYSWRSQYLLTLRDVIFPYDPIFQEDYGQIDASIFYNVNENLKLGLQGVNLTNAVTKTTAAVESVNGEEFTLVPRGWYMNDRRITAIARLSF